MFDPNCDDLRGSFYGLVSGSASMRVPCLKRKVARGVERTVAVLGGQPPLVGDRNEIATAHSVLISGGVR